MRVRKPGYTRRAQAGGAHVRVCEPAGPRARVDNEPHVRVSVRTDHACASRAGPTPRAEPAGRARADAAHPTQLPVVPARAHARERPPADVPAAPSGGLRPRDSPAVLPAAPPAGTRA